MIVYSGRHCNANKAEKNIDKPLTGLGKKQAIQVRDMLSEVKFDITFSSPAKRSLATARIIAPDNGIIVIPELYPSDNSLIALLKELGEAPLKDYLMHHQGPAVWNIGHDAQNHITDEIIKMEAHYIRDLTILIVSHAVIANIVALFFSPFREDKVCMNQCLNEGEMIRIDSSNAVSEHIKL